MIKNVDLKIDLALKRFLIPLSKEEFGLLESSIKLEGCRDPLVVWDSGDGLILVDGHNRFEICTKYNIPFETKTVSFNGIQDVENWMISNQLGRRNLNPDQLSYYRGLRYLRLKNPKGGNKQVQDDLVNTTEVLSKEFKVSESTIKRDAKFAQALEIISSSNIDLRNKILDGETDLKRGDILLITKAENPNRLKIKNAADLYNKVQEVKNSLLTDIEQSLSDLQEKEELPEPMFLEKSDRINRIKGQIISAMNKAIQNSDVDSINELKRLIDNLEQILLG